MGTIKSRILDFFYVLFLTIQRGFSSIYYYILNRYVRKPHIIDTKLPIMWHDTDEKILHGMFSLLVDFVEIELGRMAVFLYKKELPFNQKFGTFSTPVRFKKEGVEYLQRELTEDVDKKTQEDLDRQHTENLKILELYKWWVDIRPNRKCSMEESGLDEFYEKMQERYGSMFLWNKQTEKERKEYQKFFSVYEKIENDYESEDTEKLIQLIKIRHTLWI